MAKAVRIVYDNGLELFYKRCKANNATRFIAGIKTGHYDNKDRPGIAHFFEHMLFKGTKELSVEELRRIWARRIRSLNAYTGSKELAIHFYESNRRLEEGMKLVSEMLFDSTFPEEEIKREKGVIKQEAARDRDNRSANLFSKIKTAMFYEKDGKTTREHIFGSDEIIDSFSIKDLEQFRKKYMCANNFFVSASGPMKLSKFKKLVDKYFTSRLENNPKLKTFDEDSLKIKGKPGAIVIKKDMEKVIFGLLIKNDVAYSVDSYRDDIICGLVNSIMDSTDEKLFRQLREERGLVYTASTSSLKTAHNGAHGFVVETTKNKINECLDVLKNITEEYLKEGIKESSLEELRENRIIENDKAIRTPEAAPDRMKNFWKSYKRFSSRKLYLETLNSITITDINNMLHRFFCGSNKVYFGIIGNVEDKDFYSYAKIKKMFDFRKYAKINETAEDDKKEDKEKKTEKSKKKFKENKIKKKNNKKEEKAKNKKADEKSLSNK